MNFTLRREDGTPLVLLACCADLEGTGGLYALDGRGVTRVDPINSSSAVAHSGQLVRLLWSPPGGNVGVMRYDRLGLSCYRRLDRHGDAHHIAVYGDRYLIASTSTNSIITVTSSFETIDQWTAPGRGDAWHLNGIFVQGSNVFISAFGRFTEEREWNSHRTDGSGIVFNLHTGEDVLTQLSAPHHPRLIDGNWVVCSSALHRLLIISADSRKLVTELTLDGWTRGLAESPEHIFVGISAPRHDPDGRVTSASIAVICRHTFRLLHTIPLPAQEIGDLCLVETQLFEGCCRAREEALAILVPKRGV